MKLINNSIQTEFILHPLDIETNLDWNIDMTSVPNWITLHSTHSNGIGDYEIPFTAAQNPSVSNDRTANIRIQAGVKEFTHSITQAKLPVSVITRPFTIIAKESDIDYNSITITTHDLEVEGGDIAINYRKVGISTWNGINVNVGSQPYEWTISNLEEGVDYEIQAMTTRGQGTAVVTNHISNIITASTLVLPVLNVDISSKTVDANITSFTFSITSNTTWNITDNRDWISTSPTSGSNNQTITVNLQQNYQAQRSGTITISGAGVSNKTISVTQRAIQLYPQTIYGRSFTVGEYTGATTADGAMNNQQQINVHSTTQTLGLGSRLFLDPNANAEFETTEMSWFKIGNSTKAARIDTVGYVLEVVDTSHTLSTTSSVSWGVSGGARNISVTSNTSWLVSSSPSWVTISNGSGTGNGSFTATATSNAGTNTDERTGTIRLRTTDSFRNVQISAKQEGTKVEDEVVPSIIQATAQGGNYYFNIFTNKSWNVILPMTLPFGFTVTPMSGSGNYNNVRITVPQNYFNNPLLHSFDVNIGGTLHNVIVNQAGQPFGGFSVPQSFTPPENLDDIEIIKEDK